MLKKIIAKIIGLKLGKNGSIETSKVVAPVLGTDNKGPIQSIKRLPKIILNLLPTLPAKLSASPWFLAIAIIPRAVKPGPDRAKPIHAGIQLFPA